MPFKRQNYPEFTTVTKKLKLDDPLSYSHAEDFADDLIEENDQDPEQSFFDDVGADLICSQVVCSDINTVSTRQRPHQSTVYESTNTTSELTEDGISVPCYCIVY